MGIIKLFKIQNIKLSKLILIGFVNILTKKGDNLLC